MKRLLLFLSVLAIAISLHAQNDVTKFMGIPVDGTKQEMTRKLKAKGFTPAESYEGGDLKGEFNGKNVTLMLQTVNNKVWRVIVLYLMTDNESTIISTYNNLIYQFENNNNYLAGDNEEIPSDEDISYEISVRNKRYQASFYQLGTTDSFNSPVWFTIGDGLYDRYTLVIYYENGFNAANGQDL